MTEIITTTTTHCQVCGGTHIVLDTTGSVIFSGGEVLDTLSECLICTECGAEVPEPVSTGLTEEIPF